MSHVNNAILTFSVSEVPDLRMAELDRALNARGAISLFSECEAERSSKNLEQSVYVAAFNHTTEEDVAAAVRAVEWDEPMFVRLFWCGQNDEAFYRVDIG